MIFEKDEVYHKVADKFFEDLKKKNPNHPFLAGGRSVSVKKNIRSRTDVKKKKKETKE